MKFDLSKHELFRFAIPGAVFLLTIYSFTIKVPFPDCSVDFKSLNVLLGVALTFPLGFLVHNVYLGYHVTVEQSSWYRFENVRLWQILDGINGLAAKIKPPQNGNFFSRNRKSRLGSWFIEACLHVEGGELVRERLYELISRIHSKGASIVAIGLGLFISTIFRNTCDGYFLPLICLWAVVIACLMISRYSSIQGLRAMIEHFIRIRRNLIIDVAMGWDPFLSKKS